MWVAVQKDLFDSSYHGPFETREEAVAFAATINVNVSEWQGTVGRVTVKPLQSPKSKTTHVHEPYCGCPGGTTDANGAI